MIMVRGNELACRNEWASDLWELADKAGALQPMVAAAEFELHPPKREPEATPHEIAAVLTAQSTAAAPSDSVSRAEIDEDVVLSETQLATGSFGTVDWLLPGVEPKSSEEIVETSSDASSAWSEAESSDKRRPQTSASVSDLFGSPDQSRGSERGGAKAGEQPTASRAGSTPAAQLIHGALSSSNTSEATGFHRRLEEAHHVRGRDDERQASPFRWSTPGDASRERQHEEPLATSGSDAIGVEGGLNELARPFSEARRYQTEQSAFGREAQSSGRGTQHAAREAARPPEPQQELPMQRTVFREDPSPVPVAEAADLRGHFVGAAGDDVSEAAAAYDDAFEYPDESQPNLIETDEVVYSSIRLDAEPVVEHEPLLPTAISVAPQLERICGTCRDFRPAEGGERGWCANRWAFTHRRMVDAEDDMPCATILGGWWLPVDEIWLVNADVSSHGHPTPLMDALFNPRHEERIRRGGA